MLPLSLMTKEKKIPRKRLNEKINPPLGGANRVIYGGYGKIRKLIVVKPFCNTMT